MEFLLLPLFMLISFLVGVFLAWFDYRLKVGSLKFQNTFYRKEADKCRKQSDEWKTLQKQTHTLLQKNRAELKECRMLSDHQTQYIFKLQERLEELEDGITLQ